MSGVGVGAVGRAVVRALDRWIGGGALTKREAEGEAAEARLKAAIDAFPEGVVFLDAEGRYILWNQRYAEIYHRSADLFASGRRLSETLRIGVARGDYPEAAGREEAWLAERLAKMAQPSGERLEQRLSDGRWLMIEDRRTADGGLIGLRVDITEMKRQSDELAQALLREAAASRAKSEFLADMSHEFRTPLNGVMGLAQALEATPLNEPQRAILAELFASGARLESLVAGLLQYELGPTPAPRASAQAVSAEAGLRVLLADDNPTNRRVVELMLHAADVEVVSVENGAEAVAALGESAFDLVLMDLRMPVMDGFEAIRAIRAAEAPGQRLPIIVVSANAGPEDRDASAQAGADRHIAKPIRAENLFGAISEVLGD
ncbi:response regulator [Phenylobacterium sp.]|uniref:response regulator n=1 Tax=Phenylobacterium sp. TaxID=1871053 RepID=UPI002731492F|nr:response regulator [Phenylobacterium sp.]MDP1872921.1 response regulator [Phenylobacterium sp.]MDP3299956.1 response regulator [Phenylobacterium sp.]